MKNKYKTLIGALVMAAPLPLVISCSKSNSTQPTNNNSQVNLSNASGGAKEVYKQKEINNNFEYLWDVTDSSKFFDATVEYWMGGDTVLIKPTDSHGNAIANGHLTLKVEDIVSPTSNRNFTDDVKVSPEELMFGHKSTNLAKSLIPEKTKIRILTSGNTSDDNLLGMIFYGDNFSKNYSIEQLASGLSQPSINATSILDENSPNFFLGETIANAFNNAYHSKLGMYSKTREELEILLTISGVTNWANVLYECKEDPGNAYQIWYLNHEENQCENFENPFNGRIGEEPIVPLGCSAIGRYDTWNDDKVTILTTWNRYSRQFQTLETLIEKYNIANLNVEGFKHVELIRQDGAYGDATKATVVKIKAKDRKTMPNLIIDYPDGAQLIKDNKMSINFATQPNFDSNQIDKVILRMVNNISGVMQNDIITVPLVLGTETMFIDKPLMKFFFDVLKKHGATINTSSTFIREIDSMNIGNTDLLKIQNIWGVAPTITDSSLNGYVVNEETFMSYESIIELGNKVMEVTRKVNQGLHNAHFIGNDSPSNLVFNLTESMKYSSEYDPLFNVEQEHHEVIDAWTHDGKAKQSLDRANKLILDGLKTGSLWLGGSGEYGSNLFTGHRIALSVSTSASYPYAYVSNNGSYVLIDRQEYKVIPAKAGDHGELATFINGRFKNNIKSNLDRLDPRTDMHNFRAKTLTDTHKIEEAVKNGDYIVNLEGHHHNELTSFDVINVRGDTIKLNVIPHDDTNYPLTDYSGSVNKDDVMVSNNVGLKAFGNSLKSTILAQGPGIIGVHSNTIGDKAASLFVNWLYSGRQIMFNNAFLTPSQFLSKQSGYVVPFSGYQNSTNHSEGMGEINSNSLSVASDVNNNVVFSNIPFNENYMKTRNSIDTTLRAARDVFNHDGTMDVDQLYNQMKLIIS